jgi:hypothetical protein
VDGDCTTDPPVASFTSPITITVEETNLLSVITSVTALFVDIDGDVLTYSLSNVTVVPPWLDVRVSDSFIDVRAVLVPYATVGNYPLIVKATDPSGLSAVNVVTLVVTPSDNGTLVGYGPWSVCSVDCEVGEQRRSVFCTNIVSQLLPPSSCPKFADTIEVRPCNVFVCPNTLYHVEEWDTCTGRCYSGAAGGEPTVLRPVYCMLNNEIAGFNNCDDADLPRPRRIRDCNLELCGGGYHWQPSAWGACSVVCGYGLQQRQAVCVDPRGATVPSSYCAGVQAPRLQRTCASSAGCTCTGVAAGGLDSCLGNSYCDPATRRCVCLDGWTGVDCSFNRAYTNVRGCNGTWDTRGQCCPYERHLDVAGLCCPRGADVDGNGVCCVGKGTPRLWPPPPAATQAPCAAFVEPALVWCSGCMRCVQWRRDSYGHQRRVLPHRADCEPRMLRQPR